MEDIKLHNGQLFQISTDSSSDDRLFESKLLNINKNFMEISMPLNNGTSLPLDAGFDLSLKTRTLQGHEIEFFSTIISKNITKQSIFISVPPEILRNLEDRLDSKNEKPGRCKFVTVISGKGGTGKTNFIVNYAIALSSKGKKVALFDADLGMANVDILMKLTPIYNLTDVIKGERALEEIIIDAPGNVKLVPGGSGLQELTTLNAYQLERIFSGFEYLENTFDYVLIDTSSGLLESVNNFVFATNETIIVTTPEPHAISDAFSILRVLISKHQDLNLKLVVNRCESDEEGEAVVKRISGVVGNISNCQFSPVGFIPENRLVSKCIKNQTPLFLAYPDSDVSSAIESIACAELGLSRKVVEQNVVADKNVLSDMTENKNTVLQSTFVKKFKGLFAKG